MYPILETAIQECDFCAIDCEFTGVTPYRELNSFDTPKSRYEKMKKVMKRVFFFLNSNLNKILFSRVRTICYCNLVCVFSRSKKIQKTTRHWPITAIYIQNHQKSLNFAKVLTLHA